MRAKQELIGNGQHPNRTTLLELVHSLSRQDLTPDEVVRTVHDSIDSGEVVLIGNFRDGLGGARKAPARPETPLEARWKAGMAMAQAGDRVAYNRLLRELPHEITRIVRSKIFDPSAVDDVVQNVLLSIHRARHTYRPERPFGPWMRAIVRNATIDHLRQIRRRQERTAGTGCVEEIADPHSSVGTERNELLHDLAQMLAEIPPAQREAVELMQIEGLSSEEAARRVGISPGALRLRAHRGYSALRVRFEVHGWHGR